MPAGRGRNAHRPDETDPESFPGRKPSGVQDAQLDSIISEVRGAGLRSGSFRLLLRRTSGGRARMRPACCGPYWYLRNGIQLQTGRGLRLWHGRGSAAGAPAVVSISWVVHRLALRKYRRPKRDEEHYLPQRSIASSGPSSAMSPIETHQLHPACTKADCWVTSSKCGARLLAESRQDGGRPPQQGAPTHKAAHSFASSPSSRCSLLSNSLISLTLLRWEGASARSFISWGSFFRSKSCVLLTRG